MKTFVTKLIVALLIVAQPTQFMHAAAAAKSDTVIDMPQAKDAAEAAPSSTPTEPSFFRRLGKRLFENIGKKFFENKWFIAGALAVGYCVFKTVKSIIAPSCHLSRYESNPGYEKLTKVMDQQNLSCAGKKTFYQRADLYRTGNHLDAPITIDGILLYGPPGTGKTTVAKAFHAASGCDSFHEVTPADLTSSNDVAQVFDTARKAKTCATIFIDEADEPLRRGSKVLNEFLTQTSHTDKNKKISLIGATNYREDIAPAAQRAERLGTHIKIDLPSSTMREDILTSLINKVPDHSVSPDVIRDINNQCEGCSFATLKMLIEDAKLNAFSRDRSTAITNQDLMDALQQRVIENRIPVTIAPPQPTSVTPACPSPSPTPVVLTQAIPTPAIID